MTSLYHSFTNSIISQYNLWVQRTK